jgi:hypothetical protein
VLAPQVTQAALALACRFSAGATMWCVAPRWPAHARHVAVEFVHPVIVGKRALPAVAVLDAEPAAVLRTGARSGDVLLAIGDDPVTADVVRRAPAWGLTSVWIGTGDGPPARADHALWLSDPDGTAPYDGRLTLVHHVLWELAHVWFEHPGLLAGPPPLDRADVCVTCSDEGRIGEVMALTAGPDVTVRTAEGVEQADGTLAGDLAPGDLVLVHAGAVIAVM